MVDYPCHVGLYCRAYYSNYAVIGHSTCQTGYVTGSGGMSYCNQTHFLSGRVGSGDETCKPRPGGGEFVNWGFDVRMLSFIGQADVIVR